MQITNANASFSFSTNIKINNYISSTNFLTKKYKSLFLPQFFQFNFFFLFFPNQSKKQQ